MPISVFALDEKDTLAIEVAKQLGVTCSLVNIHRFPDQESCVRIMPEHVTDTCVVLASLYHPDEKSLLLIFLSETLRDYGARQIIFVAPYLAYMRQDKRFNEGEGITAQYYARLISKYFDALLTVDPHLHRIHSLNEIYTIPAKALHVAPIVAVWIKKNIKQALLIGPDSESEQWVDELAQRADVPNVILDKVRHGDSYVSVSVPDVDKWLKHTPVLYDDIISTGKTMIETVNHLKKAGLLAPVCIGIHGVFSDNAYQSLLDADIDRVITSNTISHPSNCIDVSGLICENIQELLRL